MTSGSATAFPFASRRAVAGSAPVVFAYRAACVAECARRGRARRGVRCRARAPVTERHPWRGLPVLRRWVPARCGGLRQVAALPRRASFRGRRVTGATGPP
ncbi:hypothetical protein SCA03_42460 [Streptomyces cacaoi]|uniref:Uncharacterized protein n=1 Tax=Streptomyces cacaoi TaxID=1898 RepID=A0A4Y3R1V0_STRCI|nr:hypothetical protein SCA03_42460 [Streptomyces cacaoi]